MAGTKQPDDKSHFILPDLGEGVHEAEIIKWRVKPGDTVKEHQTIADMETDKALVEVPSPWDGVISELGGKEGEIMKVGAVLIRYAVGQAAAPNPIAKPVARSGAGSPPPMSTKAAAHAAENVAKVDDSANEDAGTVVGNVSGTLTVSDRFARKRGDNGAAARTSKALATPAVRRIARDLKVDINDVAPSGRGGRVTASDIESFVRSGSSAKAGPSRSGAISASDIPAGFAPHAIPVPANLPAVSGDGVTQRIPFRGVRRKIAEALLHSVRTTVHFTAVDEADVTALDRKRKEYAAVLGQKLSLLPFLMVAVCKGLRKHPLMNANVDDAKAEILLKGVVNLGCAVDTDHGLMVPVIHNADHKSLVQLSDAVKDVAARCHNRTIPREELTGGTFTISNVGSYGGMFATPIINYPEIGIIAAGRARERVLTRNGQFYAGLVLPLSISADHRVVDGAEAVRFLTTVIGLLEDPAKLLA